MRRGALAVALCVIAIFLAACSGQPSPALRISLPQSTPIPALPTPEPTPPPTLAPQPTPTGSRTYRLIFTGDIMCHEPMYQAAYDRQTGAYDFHRQFEAIRGYLEEADLSVGNLEAPLGAEDGTYSGFPSFRAPPSLMDAVAQGGFDMVTFANNHTNDGGKAGISRTLARADACGVRIVGAFDQEHQQRYILHDLGGFKVAVMAYTVFVRSGQTDIVSFLDTDKIGEDIAAARAEGAEVVIVCCHWGSEYEAQANRSQRTTARKLIALGADAVIGHHSHVLQEMEQVVDEETGKSGFVAYSLGNFVSNQTQRYRSASLLLELSYTKDPDHGSVVFSGARGMPIYTWKDADEGGGTFFQVLPAAIEPPESMRNSQKKRLSQAYADTLGLLAASGIDEWVPSLSPDDNRP